MPAAVSGCKHRTAATRQLFFRCTLLKRHSTGKPFTGYSQSATPPLRISRNDIDLSNAPSMSIPTPGRAIMSLDVAGGGEIGRSITELHRAQDKSTCSAYGLRPAARSAMLLIHGIIARQTGAETSPRSPATPASTHRSVSGRSQRVAGIDADETPPATVAHSWTHWAESSATPAGISTCSRRASQRVRSLALRASPTSAPLQQRSRRTARGSCRYLDGSISLPSMQRSRAHRREGNAHLEYRRTARPPATARSQRFRTPILRDELIVVPVIFENARKLTAPCVSIREQPYPARE